MPQIGKEAPSALAGCSELKLRGYRRLVWKSLQAWMYRGRGGSADLKHQVPCQKMGVGGLPRQAKQGARAGDSRKGRHGEGVNHPWL